MIISCGKLTSDIGQLAWNITRADNERTQIIICQQKNPFGDLQTPAQITWADFRMMVDRSGNILASVFADDMEPIITHPRFAGTIWIPKIRENCDGMTIELFLLFLRTFIIGSLKTHMRRPRI